MDDYFGFYIDNKYRALDTKKVNIGFYIYPHGDGCGWFTGYSESAVKWNIKSGGFGDGVFGKGDGFSTTGKNYYIDGETNCRAEHLRYK